MSYIAALKKEKAVIFLSLLAVLLIVPFIPNRIVTGTLVNTALLIGVRHLGIKRGWVLGCVPSSIALISGLLPLYFAPLIPCIMIANIAMMATCGSIKNYWLGFSLGAVVKGGILFIALTLIGGELAFLPFFFTALFGGAIAYIFLKK